MHTGSRTIALAAMGLTLVGLVTVAAPRMLRSARGVHPKTGAPLLMPGKDGESTLLFNGWRITPAGRHLETGDMLLGGAFSPDGKTLAIANCGWGFHAVHLIDVATEKELARLPVARAWNGIAWAPDGQRLYVGGGVSNPENDVYVFERGADGAWLRASGIRLKDAVPKQTCIAGLALSPDGKTLYALNLSDDCLYVVEIADRSTRSRTQVGDHPITCRLSADGKTLYVANLGGAEVAVVDVTAPDAPTVARRIPVGGHPNDLALGHDGRLFVSCGNDDAIYVMDAVAGRHLETVKTTLTPRSPAGSTPDAIALSSDGRTLYAANADNNDVCVIDVSQPERSRVRGFVPTGWYPTAVLASPDGRKLIIGSGKGLGSRPNPSKMPLNPIVPAGFEYIARQLSGLISFLEPPDAAHLAAFTPQVYANTPYRDAQLRSAPRRGKSAVPARVGEASPIKYVLYIIKENRTYDQVLGDMPKGNGDASLCLFGRDVTPNHHALAEQYVLLDNLYCNGEVSADGHPWSTSAYATDFTQRSWVLSYSAKGAPRGGASVADPRSGYLWEACARKGLSFRSYGEYANHKSLEGHVSQAYVGKAGPGSAPPGRDTDRAAIFIDEFHAFERTGMMPRFTVMSLGENHTNGTRVGAFTPKAMVASNDQALGRIVEAVSHSSLWKEFAIFVIEDDAQNGPDHVDSHRTVGLVISPYTRRGTVDSSFYTTASMLRTMELILGLPPLTQYDAAAPPMYASFTDRADLAPYTPLPPRIDLMARNTASAYGAARSARMDWSEYDRIDEDALNRILWHSIKGVSAPYPAPVRRVLPQTSPR